MFWREKRLSSEEEDELIEKIAQKIVNSGIDVSVILMFLETYKPGAIFWGGLTRFFSAAWLPFFGKYGDIGEELIDTFNKIGNVDKLIKKINNLIDKKD